MAGVAALVALVEAVLMEEAPVVGEKMELIVNNGKMSSSEKQLGSNGKRVECRTQRE